VVGEGRERERERERQREMERRETSRIKNEKKGKRIC
jgi:hypothetical protein